MYICVHLQNPVERKSNQWTAVSGSLPPYMDSPPPGGATPPSTLHGRMS